MQTRIEKFWESQKFKRGIIVTFVSAAIPLLIYTPHLFDLLVPVSGDVRSHIFKIDMLYNLLLDGSWPGWSKWWYEGFPLFQFYPPGFYFLGAILTFITKHSVISYKLLLFLTHMSNCVATYYFSRRFLRFNFSSSLLSLIAYGISILLLLNYMWGSVPNLLGWTVSILFLTFYLCYVSEDRRHKARDIAIPGLLLGISALIHPFPTIFSALAIIVFHILEVIKSENPWLAIRQQLPYFALVSGVGALLSCGYWLPSLLTIGYVSPIFQNLSGWEMIYFISFAILALAAGLFTRQRIKEARLNLIIIYFLLATVMGLGGSRWLPLGSFLHGFRFATIIAPFFGILLLISPINYGVIKLSRYQRGLPVAAGILLIVVLTIFPLSFTNIRPLFTYIQNYLQPEYAELLSKAQAGRLLIPLKKGLCEGDSPVTFGWHYGVETVTGPYNQGDPNFFQYTVHVEWESRWLEWETTRQNLMQEGGAKYLFIRNPNEPFQDTQGLQCIVDNSYGKLYMLHEEVARVLSVTPVLLDVSRPREVTEFFNILLPQGYRIVFADVSDVSEGMKENFNYVMIDDEAKKTDYPDKTIFLIQNVPEGADSGIFSRKDNMIILNAPYLAYDRNFFFQGKDWDAIGWFKFDYSLSSRLTLEGLNNLAKIYTGMSRITEMLAYEPVNYKYTDNKIEVAGAPGFTLIKDSYFPYWTGKHKILPTTQGFMLTYSESGDILLEYRKPFLNFVSAIISLLSLAGIIGVIIYPSSKKVATSK